MFRHLASLRICLCALMHSAAQEVIYFNFLLYLKGASTEL